MWLPLVGRVFANCTVSAGHVAALSWLSCCERAWPQLAMWLLRSLARVAPGLLARRLAWVFPYLSMQRCSMYTMHGYCPQGGQLWGQHTLGSAGFMSVACPAHAGPHTERGSRTPLEHTPSGKQPCWAAAGALVRTSNPRPPPWLLPPGLLCSYVHDYSELRREAAVQHGALSVHYKTALCPSFAATGRQARFLLVMGWAAYHDTCRRQRALLLSRCHKGKPRAAAAFLLTAVRMPPHMLCSRLQLPPRRVVQLRAWRKRAEAARSRQVGTSAHVAAVQMAGWWDHTPHARPLTHAPRNAVHPPATVLCPYTNALQLPPPPAGTASCHPPSTPACAQTCSPPAPAPAAATANLRTARRTSCRT